MRKVPRLHHWNCCQHPPVFIPRMMASSWSSYSGVGLRALVSLSIFRIFVELFTSPIRVMLTSRFSSFQFSDFFSLFGIHCSGLVDLQFSRLLDFVA